jgi:hypothetical protein
MRSETLRGPCRRAEAAVLGHFPGSSCRQSAASRRSRAPLATFLLVSPTRERAFFFGRKRIARFTRQLPNLGSVLITETHVT